MSAAKQVPVWGLVAGAAVALALGVYGLLHEPTGRDFVLWGFESAAAWKNALTLVVALLLVAQAVLSFKLAGMFGFRATTSEGSGRLSSPASHPRHRLFASGGFPLRLGSRIRQRQPRYFAALDPWLHRLRLCRCGSYGRIAASEHTPTAGAALGQSRSGATQYVVGVGAVAAVVMLFTLQGATPQADARQARTAGPIDAERLYAEHCANCHASDGSGGLGTRLAGLVVARYPDPADQSAIVASGLNTMPAFAKVITPDEIAAITTYTRTAWE